MNKLTTSCIIFALIGCWAACAPLAVPPIMTAAEKQQTYEKERYPVKVVYDPAAPQTVSGLRIICGDHFVRVALENEIAGSG